MDALNEKKVLHKHISLLCGEKNELVKQNNVLHDNLSKQEESLNELEHIKKTMRMMNSSTTALEHILVI